LASPAFTGTPTGITKAHVGLSNVDNTSDATKNTAERIATATLTNKTLTSPVIDGAAVVPQGAVVQAYNTVDQVTNYERMRGFWTGNVFTMSAEAGGTGSLRALALTSHGQVRAWGAPQSAAIGSVQISDGTSTPNTAIAGINGLQSASSGTQTSLSISPSISQTSTGGYTALLINPTETTTGSGAKKLIDAQVGGASKFAVDNAGVVTATASNTAGTALVRAGVPASATAAGVAGQIATAAGFIYVCTATNTWVRAALATW
jgi:hypothetical protein